MHQPRRYLVALALLTSPLTFPAQARAQQATPGVTATAIDEAEQFAEDAFDAYAHHDHRRAIALYEMALAAAPSADILYNIARVYDLGLSDTPNAIAYYRRYIAHSRARRPRSEFAQQRILELGGPGSAAAAPGAAGATPSGRTPTHQVSIRPDEASVQNAVAPGSLPPEAEALTGSSGWTTSELTAAALTGAGAVALSVGIGFAVSAYAERDTWRAACDGNSCASQGAVDAARAATRKADVATVALASGGGLLALAAGFWWFAPSATPSAVALEISPASSGADLGCTLRGAF
ncbi:MAG: hypothetical protein RL685_4321 [Pseudomonadota bacterium]|jgi:hypothetical protein